MTTPATAMAVAAVLLAPMAALLGQDAVHPTGLVQATPADTVRRAAAELLRHQTADGAIVMGTLPASRSHLVPYFANFAALGLAAASGETGDARYLDAARRWAAWYEAHMNPDGTICDFDGASGAWQSTGDCDSTDSYAATFLELLLAIERAAPDPAWRAAHLPAARRAVAAIRLTLQPNGLTSAKPGWEVMYLMDNVETAAGLRAAAALGLDTAGLAASMERTMTAKLWDDARQTYAVGLEGNGRLVTAAATWYPYLMANLMAVGWLPPREGHVALLGRLRQQFGAEMPVAVNTEDDLERLVWWGIAAQGAGDAALGADIAAKLHAFDAQVKTFARPDLLGHLCCITNECRQRIVRGVSNE